MNYFLSVIFLLLYVTGAYANTRNDPHAPISHCYHWLDEKNQGYLSYKYAWAADNQNELTFYTTPGTSNGSVAGPGLYCAKSPSGSYGYGDRVIRLDLVEDVVLYDEKSGIKYCGTNGETSKNSQDCGSKNWDIKFYNGGGAGNSAWYVIQNPMAISHWSATSDQLVQDLKNSITINDSQFQNHANATLEAMEDERNRKGGGVFYNQNARLSIVDIIINEPSKLDSVPPLNIVAALAGSEDDRLTTAEKNEIYRRYLHEAMKSTEIPYSDYEVILKRDDSLSKIYFELVDMALGNGPRGDQSYNSAALLSAIAKNQARFKGANHSKYAQLVRDAFLDPYQLEQIAVGKISDIKTIYELVRKELQALKNKGPDHSFAKGIKALLQQYYSKSEAKRETSQWALKLFSPSGRDITISIGRENYGVKPSKDFSSQCEGLVDLLDASDQDIELKRLRSSFPLGKRSEGACDLGEGIIELIKTRPKDEQISFVLKGKIETTPYIFVGNVIEDFQQQCDSFYPQVSNKNGVDEIFWSLNGSSSQRLYNSDSYWKTKKAVCQNLISPITRKVPSRALLEMRAAAANADAEFLVEGRFEAQPYIFYGNMLEEIDEQCRSWHSNVQSPSSVDEIYFSLNGSNEERLYNSSSYWDSANAVCSQLSLALGGKVPSKLGLERADIVSENRRQAAQTKASYILSGRFEGQEFYFFGETKEDLLQMCEEFYPKLENTEAMDEIYWSLNGSSEKRIYNDSSYWKSKSALCSALVSVQNAPTARDLQRQDVVDDLRANAQRQNAPYSISGRFEEQEFFFYGENLDQINAQCEVFHQYLNDPSNIDEVRWTVNGGQLQREYNSDSYWKNKDQLCGLLSRLAASKIPSLAMLEANELVASYKKTAAAQNSPYQVSGEIEAQEYFFFGADRGEVRKSCEEFWPHIQYKAHVDTFTYSVNGRKLEKKSSSSYWNTKERLCSAISDAISERVPTKVGLARLERVLELRNEGEGAAYIIEGNFEGQEYFFYGEDRDQINDMCESFYSYLENTGSIDNITYSINGSTEVNDYNNSSYWSSKGALCGKLIQSISRKVPSAKQLEGQRLYARMESEAQNQSPSLVVRGSANSKNFIFYGSGLSQINQQCSTYYPYIEYKEQLDTIHYSINDGAEKKLYNSQSYWNTKEKFCSALETALKNSYVEIETAKRLLSSKQKFRGLFPNTGPGSTQVLIRTELDTLYLEPKSALEASDQCGTILSHDLGPFANKTEVLVKVGAEAFRTSPISSTEDVEEFCREIKTVLAFDLPSDEMIQHKREYDKANSKYKIEAWFNHSKIYFYASDERDVLRQCEDIYAKELGERRFEEVLFQWRVLPDSKQKEEVFKDMQMGPICESFAKNALKGGFGRFLRSIF